MKKTAMEDTTTVAEGRDMPGTAMNGVLIRAIELIAN